MLCGQRDLSESHLEMHLKARVTPALLPCLAGWPEVTTGGIRKTNRPKKNSLSAGSHCFPGQRTYVRSVPASAQKIPLHSCVNFPLLLSTLK